MVATCGDPFIRELLRSNQQRTSGFRNHEWGNEATIWQVHQLKGFYVQKGGFLELDVFQFQK